MALIIEDGTGTDPDANSYCTVQEWKNYWVDRGYDFSDYTDPDIEVALIRATDYVESLYRNDWYGCPLLYEQPLSFPRADLYVRDVLLEGVPAQLKRAIHEYAKRALPGTELLPDPAENDKTGQVVQKSRKKVGPIETSVEYAPGGAPLMRRYPAADRWLDDLKCSGGGTIHA